MDPDGSGAVVNGALGLQFHTQTSVGVMLKAMLYFSKNKQQQQKKDSVTLSPKM